MLYGRRRATLRVAGDAMVARCCIGAVGVLDGRGEQCANDYIDHSRSHTLTPFYILSGALVLNKSDVQNYATVSVEEDEGSE